MIDNGLKIGELSKSGQVEILDQDRLCYKVISRSKGAYGIRTISKDLLEEFYKLYIDKPDITADEARSLLSGQSAIDKFEYGYASTIWQMAKMLGANRNNSNASLLVKKQYPDKSSAYQIIYYGAPGTGKSHRIKEQLEGVPKENIFRTTFHPDSDYSTFVGAYKPTRSERPLYGLFGKETVRLKDGKDLSEDIITYKFIPQAFLNAYMQAYRKPDENVYLIIEEINRGNCAQIFGDLFQLLDRDEYGVSEYTIKADADLKAFLEDEMGEGNDAIKDGELCLPSNLYIYATMNTSDQSLFPIDSAFKRRWDWEYEPIKYKNTNWMIDIQGEAYSWVSFQKEINRRIFEATSSEDKMLGDYFVNPSNGIITEKMLLNKILFYLWNDVCKDGEGDIFKVSDTEDVSFSELYGDGGKQKLIDMMDYLGVLKLVFNDDVDDNVLHNGIYTKRHLKIVFPDGIILEDNNSTNTLTRFINRIGPEKVYQLNLQLSDYPFISKEKFVEDGRGYANSQRALDGGYYLTTKLSTDAKLTKIQEISSRLNLNLNVAIVEI
jgi:hypothetical protein